MPYKNADFIRALPGELGSRLHEALNELNSKITTLAQQTNGNPKGAPAPPPMIAGLNVSGQGGYLHVAINDPGPIYRGIRYYVEHADNPHFTNPQIVPLRDSRNATIAVGNQTRYVRAYSAYSSSAPSSPVYHGKARPIAVNGGGSGPGPLFLPSQGSGTGDPGTGMEGPGAKPFRSPNGQAPSRK